MKLDLISSIDLAYSFGKTETVQILRNRLNNLVKFAGDKLLKWKLKNLI